MPSCDVSIQGLIPPLGWKASGYQPLSDALAESHSALQTAVPGTRAFPCSPRPHSFHATCDIEESHTCFVGSLPEKPCHVPFPLTTQKTSAPPHKRPRRGRGGSEALLPNFLLLRTILQSHQRTNIKEGRYIFSQPGEYLLHGLSVADNKIT